MPCRDPEPYYPEPCSQCPQLKRRLDRATQFLCYMIGEHRLTDPDGLELPEEISQWAAEHDHADVARIVRKVNQLNADGKTEGQALAILCDKARQKHPLSKFHVNMFREIIRDQYADNEKIKQQKLEQAKKRKAALEKLTDEERKLLGINTL